MRTIILAMALGLLGISPVLAHGDARHEGTAKEEAAEPAAPSEKTVVVPSEATVTPEVQAHEHENADEPKLEPVHGEWEFVGCVRSRHDCSRHASQEGYFSSDKVEEDEDRCSTHPHLACYGQ